MVANKTASGCAEQPVVSGVMAGDATDDGAFDAASRRPQGRKRMPP
jgi:hypothetical protein